MRKYLIVLGALLIGLFGYQLARRPWLLASNAAAVDHGQAGGEALASSSTREAARAASPAGPAGRGRVKVANPFVFGGQGRATLERVPDGQFKTELLALAPTVQSAVLAELERREVPILDTGSLRVTARGELFYACKVPDRPPPQELPADTGGATVEVGAMTAATLPLLHSRPGAPNVIFLDFTGGMIAGTAWNEVEGAPAEYAARPFDLEGDVTTLSTTESAVIRQIWQSVAESYAAFEVDVTTERPASMSDRVGRVLITRSTDSNGVAMPSSSAAGVAFLARFNGPDYASRYSPAFVYHDRLYNYSSYIGRVAAHEMGHNLALRHDGTATTEYYEGHGSDYYYDLPSWAPLMGVPYYRAIAQWSNGGYYNANNFQDDLAVLGGYLGWLADDHGGTVTSATPMSTSAEGLTARGLIDRTTDTDAFSFTLTEQTGVSFMVIALSDKRVWLELELYDQATGAKVDCDKSVYAGSHRLNAGLAAGTYVLSVTGAGFGQPMANPPTGFTAYGSLGSYAISQSVFSITAPTLSSYSSSATYYEGQTASFSIGAYGAPSPSLQWQRRVAGSLQWIDLTADSTYLNPTSSILSVVARLDMNGDQFRCRARNIAGTVYSPEYTLTVNRAQLPQIYQLPATVPVEYGNSINLYPSIAGTSPFTYQWSKDGVPLSNSNSSSYYKSGATSADAGVYTLTVTNAAGSVTSSGARVIVGAMRAPEIYGLPQNVRVAYGEYLNLSPSTSGTQPMTFQWERDGVAVSGMTSSYLSKSVALPADSGSWVLVATNAAGTTRSAPVNVVVAAATPPTVRMPPSPLEFTIGYSLQISPSYGGSGSRTYRWFKDGVEVSGQTSSSFYKSSPTIADLGVYTVQVTNDAGSVTSSGVTVIAATLLAPRISDSSLTRTLAAGDSYFYLSPTVSGSSPIAISWTKDGTPISGATSSFFNKSNVSVADAGVYTITATNSVGSATLSYTVTVSPPRPPIVAVPAQTVAAVVGQSISLGVSVYGTAPFTYQWWKNGVALSGADGGSLSFSEVQLSDAGEYYLVATNSVGTARGATIRLVVDAAIAPGIFQLPTSVTVDYGETISFSALVTGSTPMRFRWYKNLVPISDATSSYLFIYGATSAQNGSYVLEASNAAGTTRSSSVTVNVNPAIAPSITQMPARATVAYGGSLSIAPSYAGTRNFTYQWTKDGVPLPAQTSSSLYIYNVTTADSGLYRVTVRNVAGVVESSDCTVTVSPPTPPEITSIPTSVIVSYGNTLSIRPSVSGSPTITYQWRRDGVDIPGANSVTLSIAAATGALAGSYTLTATNLAGSVTSPAVTVIVDEPIAPAIYQMPSAVAVDSGERLNFSATVVGTGPLAMVWRRNGVVIANSNSSGITLDAATVSDAGEYTLTVSNAWGTATSSVVSVTVNPPSAPQVVSVSNDSTVAYGSSISLNATVTGTRPQTLYWLKNGVIVPASNSNSLYIYSATEQDAGNYVLVVRNSVGEVRSREINVRVLDPVVPTITQQPLSAVAPEGVSLRLVAGSSGTAPISHQWYRNGEPASTSSGSTLYFEKVGESTYGDYTVVATNVAGSAQSAVATISRDPGLPVLAVAMGSNFSAWIRSDGSLWTTGVNDYGQGGRATTQATLLAGQVATGVAKVATGSSFTAFLKTDGTLWGMGSSISGQLGTKPSFNPTPAQIAAEVIDFAAGASTLFFIKADRTLWAQGNRASGGLGDGSSSGSRSTPVQIDTDVAMVSAADQVVGYVKTDGTAWTAGANNSGQLGDGTETTRTVPVQIATTVRKIAMGPNHLALLKLDGTLWTAGSGSSGATGSTANRSTLEQVTTDVSDLWVAQNATFFLRAGSLYAMGNNQGQLSASGVYSSTTIARLIADQVTAVASNGSSSLMVRAGGELWAAGSNYNGVVGFGELSSFNGFRRLLRVTATAPAIAAPPLSQRVSTGASASFTVAAVGTLPMTYQWRRNGVPIDGATGETLLLPNVSQPHQGEYDVVVRNAMGEVTSAAAALSLESQVQSITFAALPDLAFTTQPLALSATASSGLPVTFSVVSGAASVSGANLALLGTGNVTVRASQPGDSTYAAATPVDRSFVVLPNFNSWQLDHFTPTELLDGAVSGSGADADRDGLANLVEYALGLDPRTVNTTGMPQLSAVGSELVFTYTRPADRADVSYTVEQSTDLVTWSATGVTLERTATDGTTESWRATAPLGAGARTFLRLRVEKP